MDALVSFILVLTWVAAIVCLAHPVAKALGVVDHPGAQTHKAHNHPTPLVGGLASLPPTLAALLYSVDLPYARLASELWAIILATSAAFVIGLCDDRRHIPATLRLGLSSLAFAGAIALCPGLIVSAVTINYLGWSASLGAFAMPFTVLCLVGFQNAVNMADGRNGLVTGVSIIWLVTLLSFGAHPSNLAVAVMLCAMVVVWIENLKGHLFLGDAGSYGIGAFIGLVIIWFHHTNTAMHTTAAVTLLLIPVLDMLRLFVWRLLQRKHPFSADHSHLHHYLDRALGWNRGRLVYYALVALPIFALRTGLLPGLFCVVLGGTLYTLTILLCGRNSEAHGQLAPQAPLPSTAANQ